METVLRFDERKSNSVNQIACGGSGILPRHRVAVSCCSAESYGWVLGTISATTSSMRLEGAFASHVFLNARFQPNLSQVSVRPMVARPAWRADPKSHRRRRVPAVSRWSPQCPTTTRLPSLSNAK